MIDPEKPPELAISRWFNAKEGHSLQSLRGKVVVALAFQMLCPGCVEYALPQAKRLAERFSPGEVAVIGLHTVFEHHDAMGPDVLEAFLTQYGWPFPIGVDEAGTGQAGADGKLMPKTMSAYQLQGTPTFLLFDRQGRLRRHYFGRPDELMLGAEIMALAIEPPDASREISVGIEKLLAATLVSAGEPDEAPHDDAHDHDGHGHHHEHDHDHHKH